MIRIGYTRWHLEGVVDEEIRRPEGLVVARLRALPLVSHYVLTRIPPANPAAGETRELRARRDVETPAPFEKATVFARTDARRDALGWATTIRSLVDEFAPALVGLCAVRSLFQPDEDPHAYAATVGLVHVASLRAIQSAPAPPPEPEAFLDLDVLHGEARALVAARRLDEAQQLQAARRTAARRDEHRWRLAAEEEDAYRRWLHAGGGGGRDTGELSPSLDLIREVCTPAEFEEFRRDRRITVRASDGRSYVVHPGPHGLVECFGPDGAPAGLYCVVFRSGCLPPGDEVAMKVAYLKADLATFLRAANHFPIPHLRPRRRRAAL